MPMILASSLVFTGCGESSSSTDLESGEITSSIDLESGAISSILNYAEDQTQPAPTVGTYILAGVAGVTEDNLADINALVAILEPEDVDTAEEIQVIFDTNNLDDFTPPVITLLGENPQEIEVGTPYVELGATAWDNVDGDITSKIVIDIASVDGDITSKIVINASKVDTNAIGTYSVTYNVSDARGNAAKSATRKVDVVDKKGDGDGIPDDGDGIPDPISWPEITNPIVPAIPFEPTILGNKLDCSVPTDTDVSTDAEDYNASEAFKSTVSSPGVPDDVDNRENPTSHNTITRLGTVVNGAHPIVINYLQQVVGDYETGDGSADIGDPTHLDAVFVAVSTDNGNTWNSQKISDTTAESSKTVSWYADLDNPSIENLDTNKSYPGNALKPDMAVNGNNILVAWNDKYCPNPNPFNLDANGTFTPGGDRPNKDNDTYTVYPEDYFDVNGEQGSINYALEEGDAYSDEVLAQGYFEAPNGKAVFEVPFSCVWTARGVFNGETINWQEPQQLTSGTRDSNHIWIAASDAGFAMSWQEDTFGLKAGEGAGPGDGWSGATGNRGTDIWYSSLRMTDFTDPTKKFHYPVRITDNELCNEGDRKVYCRHLAAGYDVINTGDASNSPGQDKNITRIITPYIDELSPEIGGSMLDGDTGASRSALRILKTDAGEDVVILAYEETKALTIKDGGTQDQGTETNISAEGKVVRFESFNFEAIYDVYDENNVSSLVNAEVPMISGGHIINQKAPDRFNPSEMIYENARRVVIGTQIDSCDANETNSTTFALLYKQSFDVQGASSDMFVRVNKGFKFDSFEALPDGYGNEHIVTNVSAQDNRTVERPEDYTVAWSEGNLDDNTYDNGYENTFSPRIFLRGENIYVGFEYKPNDASKDLIGIMPNNFHIHRYADDGDGNGTRWQGPQNLTQITDEFQSTVDARFFTTPKGNVASGLASDISNPNVLFLTWGNIGDPDPEDGIREFHETDLYYKRSTDNGITWDENTSVLAKVSGEPIEEKEVNSYASADGKTIYNVWIQEEDEASADLTNPDSGVDSWFGRVDYDINNTIVPEPLP